MATKKDPVWSIKALKVGDTTFKVNSPVKYESRVYKGRGHITGIRDTQRGPYVRVLDPKRGASVAVRVSQIRLAL